MTREGASPAPRPKGKTPDRGHLFTAAVMLALAAVGLYGLHRELTATVVEPSEVAAAVALVALCGSLGTVLLLPRKAEEHRLHPVLTHTLGWSIGLAFLFFGAVLLADPRASVIPGDRRFSTVDGVLWIGLLMCAIGLAWVIALTVRTIHLLRLPSTEPAAPAPPPSPAQRRRLRKRRNRAAGRATTRPSSADRVPPKRPRR